MYNMDSVPHMKKGKKNVLNALKVVYEMLSEERMELGMYGVLYFLERKKNVYLFRVFFFTYIKEIHNFILLLECLSSFSFI